MAISRKTTRPAPSASRPFRSARAVPRAAEKGARGLGRRGLRGWGAIVAALAALPGLSACLGPPPVLEPPPDPPPAWRADFARTPGDPVGWLAAFDAPVLDGLVAEALAHNHDLRAAALRVDAARAQAVIAGADRLPAISAGADAARSRSVGAGGYSTLANAYSWDAMVSWEADLWDRLGATSRAAARELAATQADFDAARLSLAANVVRGWIQAVEADHQARLARQTSESQRRTLAVIEGRYRGGLSDALDVRLARADLASAEASLAARRRERDAALRALEILLGRYPDGALTAQAGLPEVDAPIPAGVPAQLLARRPDLLAAERRLDAAGERLKNARRNRLPTLTLTAQGGESSSELRDLLDWDRLIWKLAAGLVQPIFQGGALEAAEDQAAINRRIAWTDYAAALLTAFREVESALAADGLRREQEAALTRAAHEAALALELALDRYREGLTGVITLLEAQRRAHNAESARLAARRARLENRVALYLALGGDFATPTPSSTLSANGGSPANRDPAPDAVSDSASAPEPAPVLVPDSIPDATPDSVPDATPDPAQDSISGPARDPAPDVALDSVSGPVRAATPDMALGSELGGGPIGPAAPQADASANDSPGGDS